MGKLTGRGNELSVCVSTYQELNSRGQLVRTLKFSSPRTHAPREAAVEKLGEHFIGRRPACQAQITAIAKPCRYHDVLVFDISNYYFTRHGIPPLSVPTTPAQRHFLALLGQDSLACHLSYATTLAPCDSLP